MQGWQDDVSSNYYGCMLEEYYDRRHSLSSIWMESECFPRTASKPMHLQLPRYLPDVQQIHIFCYLQGAARKTRASFGGFALKLHNCVNC